MVSPNDTVKVTPSLEKKGGQTIKCLASGTERRKEGEERQFRNESIYTFITLRSVIYCTAVNNMLTDGYNFTKSW